MRSSFLARLRAAAATTISRPWTCSEAETAGIIVIANEVAAALDDRWLSSPSLTWLLFEKFVLIVLSTAVIFIGFWYWHIPTPDYAKEKLGRRLLCYGATAMHFTAIVLLTITLNALLVGFISFHSFRNGELIDPVTPVIGAFLDIFVDLCAMIKNTAPNLANRIWRSGVR